MATIPEALSLALQHHRAGRLRKAEALYRQILQEKPEQPDALHNLGVLAYQVGKYGAAVAFVGRAIQANPGVAGYYNTLGEACRAQGKFEDAAAHYRQALALQPAYAEAHNNLGSVRWAQGKIEESAAHFRQAVALKPVYAEAHNNLGSALGTQGKPEEAAVHFRKALALKPAYAEAHNNLGNVLKEQGKADEAVAHYRQALTLRPAYAEAHNNLGTALQEQGKLGEAEASYRQALALKPDYAEAHNNLGNVLRELKGNEQAIACYQKAIALNPSFAGAHQNLGAAFREQGKVDEAMAHFRQAASLRPTDGLKIVMATLLPVVARSKDDLLEARGRFSREVAALMSQNLSVTDPVKEVGMTNFHLASHGQNDRDLQVMVAQLYERACPALLYTSPHCAAWPSTQRGGKIKIGFISKFLKNHSVGKAARGVLANLSRDRFSVTALLASPVADDEISRFVRQKADKTLVLPGNLQAAREAIAAEELDILFYQDIGMDPFTYFLSFARLAPVQCLFFGHADTSGIRNLDYFISSAHLEPPKAEEHYSERLIRLKSCMAYYYKPKVPAVLKSRRAFGFDDADHVYLCPQTLYKFHPDMDGLFAGILEADPRARLVLKDGKERHWTDLLLSRFRRTLGHAMSRVTVLPQQPAGDFIRLIAVSDVMLDTRPFSGYTTSLEAFAVGTPVVTWPGEFQRGRLTLSLYKDMGISDCVAKGPKEYVDIAVRLGTDKAYRDRIKSKILKKNQCLYEDHRTVKEYGRAFLGMVKDARAAKPDRAAPRKRR